MAYQVKKSEHAGAKNGGGFWGTRYEAKSESSRVRRHQDKAVIRGVLDGERSPFDVPGVASDVSADNIVVAVRESRER